MTDLDLIRDVIGIELAAERTAENLVAYAYILAEIGKLRALDLGAVHPAVVFRPLPSVQGDDDV